MTKSANRKVSARKARNAGRKTDAGLKARKAPKIHRKNAPEKVAAEQARGNYQWNAELEELRRTLVPGSMHVLAQQSVAQTREFYERYNDTLRSVYESWEKSFGAAGAGAAALNRKVIDIAERNISNSFELATRLAGAKNFAEAIKLQTGYWRKQFSDLSAQAEEVQALTRRVSADVAEPIKSRLGELKAGVRSA